MVKNYNILVNSIGIVRTLGRFDESCREEGYVIERFALRCVVVILLIKTFLCSFCCLELLFTDKFYLTR